MMGAYSSRGADCMLNFYQSQESCVLNMNVLLIITTNDTQAVIKWVSPVLLLALTLLFLDVAVSNYQGG